MRRVLALACILALLVAPVAAQAPEQAPDQSGGSDQGPPAEKQPSLPEQASATAKKVLDTIFGFTAETFSSIGQALQNLLGGGEQRSTPDPGQGGSGSGSGG